MTKRRGSDIINFGMKNIVLIGMPAAGKTTVGKMLCERLGLGFIDADRAIEGEEDEPLPQIIQRVGAEGFIKIEERVNLGLRCERCVIATGGSAVYSERAMRFLKESGTLVYLKISKDEVLKRIPSFQKRGVVMRGDICSLAQLYDERAPLYERYADITVDCGRQSVTETVDAVLNALTASEEEG